MTGEPIDRALDALASHGCPARANGHEQWSAKCPHHADGNPSLSIAVGEGGRVLFNCHAGCTADEVTQSIGLKLTDLFPPRDEREAGQVITYPYTDEGGTVLFEVVRRPGKQFRQRKPNDQGGWDWSVKGVRQVLYRLPDVVAAIATGQTVWVVEGEKDADALARAGQVATCNAMGAGSWTEGHARQLDGAAKVIVIADRDGPGLAHARTVAASLTREGRALVVAHARGGKDMAEHLGKGGALAELEALWRPKDGPTWLEGEDGGRRVLEALAGLPSSVAVTHEPAPEVHHPDGLFTRYTFDQLMTEPRDFRWLLQGVLVQPTYGMVAGERKSLKTYLSLFMDLAIATGLPLFGQFEVPTPGPVIMYAGEGGRIPFARRLERIAKAMGTSMTHVPFFASFDVAPIASARFRESLERDLIDLAPALVHIDPYYAFHGASTNAANLHEEGGLLASLSGLIGEYAASLMLNNHFSKSGGHKKDLDSITMSGGGEWVDTWLLLHHRKDPNVANGLFHLTWQIGSRQWGGTNWDLDLEVGAFDVDTGEFDGSITWDIRPHNPADVGDKQQDEAAKDDRMRNVIAGILEDKPYQLTKTQIIEVAGGRAAHARAVLEAMAMDGSARFIVTKSSEGGRAVERPKWGLVELRPTRGPGWDGVA